MPSSKHNVTKRGSQKQRVKTHDAMLAERYPDSFGYANPQVETPEEIKAETVVEKA